MNVFGNIYLIANIVNGKLYVGQTRKDIYERWKTHVRTACYSKRPLTYLHKAIRYYGKSSFVIRKLATVYGDDNLDLINQVEKFYIKYLDTNNKNRGYNLDLGGCGIGKEISQETRLKISIAAKGRPSAFKGKHHSPESRLKLSQAAKKRVCSDNLRLKRKQFRTGTKHSSETIEKN